MSHDICDLYLSFSFCVSQLKSRAEGHVARGQAEHHRGHQTTPDCCDTLQKLHDLSGGEPGQQGKYVWSSFV